LAALSREAKFKKDAKKVIALKKKRTFLGRYKRGPLGGLSREAKFKQDAKPRSDVYIHI
jgi:hypothetical protein